MSEFLQWQESCQSHQALWRSENGSPLPRKVMLADDRMSADQAYKLVCEGCALLWRGDFHNARQLLQALTRRIERKAKIKAPAKTAAELLQAFHAKRSAQVQKTRILSMLVIAVQPDYSILLRRAPELQQAFVEVYGPPPSGQLGDTVEPTSTAPAFITPLREIMGINGAHEWRKKGIFIHALQNTIHPWYGVFAPTRNEYIDLLAKVALPKSIKCVFDIGTGTGVLAAVLAVRGAGQVVATDQEPRALACARENLQRLGLSHQVRLLQADLFPPGSADLIVCNPPWLPCRPSSPLEAAIYDPDSRMVRQFLSAASAHLNPAGQVWLIMSDLAELLGMRTRQELQDWIAKAGLQVLARHDIRPRHQKAQDEQDPLHAARAAEVISLWCLQANPSSGK